MSSLQWTEPPELLTGVTNLLIVAVCVVCGVRIIRSERAKVLRELLWLAFFGILIPTGIYGFVVHAFVLQPETKRIAWIFLSFLLGLTTTVLSITLFFEIFGRPHLKAILIVNAAAEILFAGVVCFLSKIVPNIHFVFITYTGIVFVVLLALLFIDRKKQPHFRWYIFAILTVVIGGLFEVCGDFTFSLIWKIDQGSMCHLAIAAALCFFAEGCVRGTVRRSVVASGDGTR